MRLDISFLSGGTANWYSGRGVLYLLDDVALSTSEVNGQRPFPAPSVNSNNIRNLSASQGKRIVFEARGELFNVPELEGYILNLTASSGAFDMLPSWSPDGLTIAFWSDRSGEYEIYLQDPGKTKEPVQLTSRGKGFGYQLFWSPDSKKIAFIDETNDISVIYIASRRRLCRKLPLECRTRGSLTITLPGRPILNAFLHPGMDSSHDASCFTI
jgi:tricorn protease